MPSYAQLINLLHYGFEMFSLSEKDILCPMIWCVVWLLYTKLNDHNNKLAHLLLLFLLSHFTQRHGERERERDWEKSKLNIYSSQHPLSLYAVDFYAIPCDRMPTMNIAQCTHTHTNRLTLPF